MGKLDGLYFSISTSLGRTGFGTNGTVCGVPREFHFTLTMNQGGFATRRSPLSPYSERDDGKRHSEVNTVLCSLTLIVPQEEERSDQRKDHARKRDRCDT